MNPLKKLCDSGQSFWLDYLRRSLITNGELSHMVEEDGLRGITSNPTIFEKAIAGSSDYDDSINDSINSDPHLDIKLLFERLAIEDIQMAADVLRPVYEGSKGADGFVSFELSPKLACDTEGSIAEARRLWKTINRPNVMLKVPATKEGIPVVETLIANGINVNVTLIFSLTHYEAVANAYLRGLEKCPDPSRVASVASFFLSRLDRIVDKALKEHGSPKALKLRGKIAIANAKLAYKRFKEIFGGEQWERLAQRGAKVQRVLWASTSTKNPEYSDVLYVEELIGSQTINTLPPITINAFRDHGQVNQTLEKGLKEAENAIKKLESLSLDLNALTEKLQEDGVDAFSASIDKLYSTLEEKRQAILQGQADLRTPKLGKYQTQVDRRLEYWKEINFASRIWAKDPTLWFPKPMPEIADRLGWLTLPELMHEQLEDFVSFAKKVRSEGTRHIVLLGMGGSSLAPEVFQKTLGNAKGYPKLTVLDSTHPPAIRAVENSVDLQDTLFLISSKSGTTIETLSLFRYFWNKIGDVDEDRGRHFIAITDPGSPLTKLAEERGFRKVFLAPSDVGGRFSALTVFGLLPAALIGVDVHKLLDRAWTMSENCAFCVSSHKSSGLVLGAALGELTKAGRDKVTFLTSPSLSSFMAWLEQLLAESTGKSGKGIIPVVDEPLMSPEDYGNDRFFIYFHIKEDENPEVKRLVKKLEDRGHPVIWINLTEKINISQEIFCWEMAVAAAGAILGIHPFNQPNVQMAKDLAKRMMEKAKKIELSKIETETVSPDDPETLAKALNGLLNQAEEGNYLALQAYLQPTPETTETLQEIRQKLSKKLRLATTLGFGPRFLHSTGQLHKGGANTGLFLQFVNEPEDLAVPETNYTFGTLIRSQALGDYQALKQLCRRALRINLKRNLVSGLSRVMDIFEVMNNNVK